MKKDFVIITKALCPSCNQKKMDRHVIDPKCTSCKFLRHKANNLLSFKNFLDKSHPTWVYFNVYEKTKEGRGNQLDNFIKGKKEPSSKWL